MTQTGMTLGTAYYMAPEQRIAAKEVDWRADQYALGVVLYELLAGTLPTGAVKPLETSCAGSAEALCTRVDARDVAEAGGSLPVAERSAGGDRSAGAQGRGRDRRLVADRCRRRRCGSRRILRRSSQRRRRREALAQRLSRAAGRRRPLTSRRARRPTASVRETAAALDAAADSADDSLRRRPPTEQIRRRSRPRRAARQSCRQRSVQVGRRRPRRREPRQRARRRESLRRITSSQSMRAARSASLNASATSGECRSINRRGKQDCMRAVAFGGSGRLTATTSAPASCAFYGQARCDRASNRDALPGAHDSTRYTELRQLVGEHRVASPGLRRPSARIRPDVPGRAARLPLVLSVRLPLRRGCDTPSARRRPARACRSAPSLRWPAARAARSA